MSKSVYFLLILSLFGSCTNEESNEDRSDVQNDFEPKIISTTPNEVDLIESTDAKIVLTDIIKDEFQTELPNSFKLKGVSPQNPGVGVLESKLYEYVEPGNAEITFFFIKTVYESKDQTIDSHYEAIKNGPRLGSDRKVLEKREINEVSWLYEQYIMNEPNGTPVTYDDYIFINADIMYGMTVCCNSEAYPKWASVIEKVKNGLVVL